MFSIEVSGNFKNTERFLDAMSNLDLKNVLKPLAERGVQELALNTPIDSGLTASSWEYDIKVTKSEITITWYNTHVIGSGTPVAILLQYGHATGTGGYVRGRDFINPAMAPIFDKIRDEVWKVVTSA